MKNKQKRLSPKAGWAIVVIVLAVAVVALSSLNPATPIKHPIVSTPRDTEYLDESELNYLRAQLRTPGTQLFPAMMFGISNGFQTATYVSNSSVQFVVCSAHFFKTTKPHGSYWISTLKDPDRRIYLQRVRRMVPERGGEVDMAVCYPGNAVAISNFWTGTVDRKYIAPQVLELTPEERQDSKALLLTRNKPIQLVGIIDTGGARPYYAAPMKFIDGESGSGAMSKGGKLYILSGTVAETDPRTYDFLGIPPGPLGLFLQF
jgi:hypothetical protein